MKETRKQIVERTRSEVARQYSVKIEEMRGQYERLFNEFEQLSKQVKQLRTENDSLREINSQYEDWINRLQDFCNLPDEEREEAINRYKLQKSIDKKMSVIANMFGGCGLFNLF